MALLDHPLSFYQAGEEDKEILMGHMVSCAKLRNRPGLGLRTARLTILWIFGEHCLLARAFIPYWGDNRFESLSTHHCWALSKFFIPSLVVWWNGHKQKITHLPEKSKKIGKKSKGEQSGLCDLEQVTLKPQLQVHHYLTTWLRIWYHSLLWGDSIRKGADLEKRNCLFGFQSAELWKLTSLLSFFKQERKTRKFKWGIWCLLRN